MRGIGLAVSGALVFTLTSGCTEAAPDVESTLPSASPSVSSAGSLASEYQGTWEAETGMPKVTLAACALNETCGQLERIDDNQEHCVYELEYRGATGVGALFYTSLGNSFGCGWSGWSHADLVVRLATADAIEVAIADLPAVPPIEATRVGP